MVYECLRPHRPRPILPAGVQQAPMCTRPTAQQQCWTNMSLRLRSGVCVRALRLGERSSFQKARCFGESQLSTLWWGVSPAHASMPRSSFTRRVCPSWQPCRCHRWPPRAEQCIPELWLARQQQAASRGVLVLWMGAGGRGKMLVAGAIAKCPAGGYGCDACARASIPESPECARDELGKGVVALLEGRAAGGASHCGRKLSASDLKHLLGVAARCVGVAPWSACICSGRGPCV